MGRAPCCDKATVKKGPWSAEEDAVLKAYIEENGTGGNWIQLPHKIGLNRCGKSCRLRWLNYLRPNIRHGSFTKEEDRVICSLYISIGSRWSTIAAQLPGRTDNDVKNHWNTKLKRRLLGGARRPRVCERLLLTDSQLQNSFTASALERMQLGVRLHRRHERLESSPAFTLYNYSSSLGAMTPAWPSPAPSSSPSPAASDCSEMQLRQLPRATSTGHSGFWSHMQRSFGYACAGVQESSLDGTCTPTSTITGETTPVGVESTSSTPTASSDSATFGSMQDEIDMLLQQMQSFEEDGLTGEVANGVERFFGEVDHVTLEGSAGSSCSTPGVDSVFQDFVQGYDQ